MAFVQQVAQVVLHDQRAARHVDQVAAQLQPLQPVTVQDAARVVGQRQQADEHARGLQEVVQLGIAREAAHAFDLASRAAPAQHRKVERLHRPRHAAAERAQAHDADGKVRTHLRRARLPVALALLPLVGRELAEEADQRMAHVLGHLHRHAGIFEPHHLQRRRQAQRHQLVDARAEVEHGLELRLLVEQLLRRAPDQRRVVIGWQAGPPFVDLRTEQRGVQVSQPSVSRAAVAVAQQQLHAAPVPRRSSSAPSVT